MPPSPDEPTSETPEMPDDETTVEAVDTRNGAPDAAPASTEPPAKAPDPADRMNERLERLGGEPAPVITPEEFARLQKAGQVHIDARGRVRTERPRGVDPGVSLRKRRAWYSNQ